MSCEFNEDLVALLDGELHPARAEAVTAHLPGCAGCRAQVAQLERLSVAVAALEQVAPPQPGALRARVLEDVARPAGSPLGVAWARLTGGLRPWLLVPALAGLGALAWLAGPAPSPAPAPLESPLPGWASELPAEPAQLEAALVLDELDELELGALETAEDLEVVAALEDLEQEGRP